MGPAIGLEFAEVRVAPALALQISGHCAGDPASLGQAMRDAFEALMSFVTCHGLIINGDPRAIYTAYDAAGVRFIAALPVAAGPREPVEQSPVIVEMLPEMQAYRFTHHGPYSQMAQTYGQITTFLKDKGLLQSDADWERFLPMWEEYRNDPNTTPPADLLTYIYVRARAGAKTDIPSA